MNKEQLLPQGQIAFYNQAATLRPSLYCVMGIGLVPHRLITFDTQNTNIDCSYTYMQMRIPLWHSKITGKVKITLPINGESRTVSLVEILRSLVQKWNNDTC
jgi:hypothetical protein